MKSQVRFLESGGRTALAARGLFWLLAQVAGGRATSFVSQIILARLLSPQDFGTIGLTYTVTTIIGSLTDSGIENVLLQRGRTFQLWAWPGFWINMALALIGAALVLALAPFFASLYGAPEIEGLAAVAAFAMPFSALSMIPMTAIRAGLNFRLLAMVGTAELIATQLLTLCSHGMGWGPTALLSHSLSSRPSRQPGCGQPCGLVCVRHDHAVPGGISFGAASGFGSFTCPSP
jgi:O-antigen/teichoic acid export membrane protein